jgi:hypothetical protein
MPIPIETGNTAGTPVVSRRAFGEKFVGCVVRIEQRNRLKDGEPLLNQKGKNAQELIVHLVAVESTMTASLGDEGGIPAPGDRVRLILKGMAFSGWIDAVKTLPGKQLMSGDLVTMTSDYAEEYDTLNVTTVKKRHDTQAAVDAARLSGRAGSIAFRGSLTITRPGPEHAKFVALADEAALAERPGAAAVNPGAVDPGAL